MVHIQWSIPYHDPEKTQHRPIKASKVQRRLQEDLASIQRMPVRINDNDNNDNNVERCLSVFRCQRENVHGV